MCRELQASTPSLLGGGAVVGFRVYRVLGFIGFLALWLTGFRSLGV